MPSLLWVSQGSSISDSWCSLQVGIAEIPTKETGLNEGIIGHLDPEATRNVQLLRQTENQVDDENDTDGQPGNTDTDRGLRSEQVNGNPLGGRDVDSDVGEELRVLEAELQSRIEEILPDFHGRHSLTGAFDASDSQVDISIGAIPAPRKPLLLDASP